MKKMQRVALSALALAMIGTLAACGGGGGDDNGDSTPNADTNSSAGSSTSSSAGTSSGNNSSVAGSKTCPADYRSISSDGAGGIMGATISVSSQDGMATFSVQTPKTSIGSYKICIGTPDANILPTADAGMRYYEVIEEGNYKDLLNPTVTIKYSQAGAVTINYLAIPAASGAAYGTYDSANNLVVDTRYPTNAVAKGTTFVATVTSAAPGLYMTSEPTP